MFPLRIPPSVSTRKFYMNDYMSINSSQSCNFDRVGVDTTIYVTVAR